MEPSPAALPRHAGSWGLARGWERQEASPPGGAALALLGLHESSQGCPFYCLIKVAFLESSDNTKYHFQETLRDGVSKKQSITHNSIMCRPHWARLGTLGPTAQGKAPMPPPPTPRKGGPPEESSVQPFGEEWDLGQDRTCARGALGTGSAWLFSMGTHSATGLLFNHFLLNTSTFLCISQYKK